MKIFFSGIGGIGISALAQFCVARGDEVCGSDSGGGEGVALLEKKGVKVYTSHDADHLDGDTDLLVYTEAVGPDNPERLRAQELGIPQQSYFEYLGEVSQQMKTIAVCGTHGKTTTVGLITAGFLKSDFEATVFVGSKLKELDGTNFRGGDSEYLLVEACEYRNNFRFLRPHIVLLTNAELDHVDYYRDQAHYTQTLKDFCHSAEFIIHHPEDDLVADVLAGYEGKTIEVGEGHQVQDLSLSGQHNRDNAALARALSHCLELEESRYESGLSEFWGAGRRQEFLGVVRGVSVFDDYGHHPTEIKATLQAFREKFPEAKIGLVFEPHQYSRTRAFFDDFVSALVHADHVGIFPIYAARDTQEDRASVATQDLVVKVDGACLIETCSDVDHFINDLYEGDVLLFMGAGKIGEFARRYVLTQ